MVDLNRHRYSLLALSLVLVLSVFLAYVQGFSMGKAKYHANVTSLGILAATLNPDINMPVGSTRPLAAAFASQSKVDSVGLANALSWQAEARPKSPALGRIDVSVCPHIQVDLDGSTSKLLFPFDISVSLGWESLPGTNFVICHHW